MKYSIVLAIGAFTASAVAQLSSLPACGVSKQTNHSPDRCTRDLPPASTRIHQRKPSTSATLLMLLSDLLAHCSSTSISSAQQSEEGNDNNDPTRGEILCVLRQGWRISPDRLTWRGINPHISMSDRTRWSSTPGPDNIPRIRRASRWIYFLRTLSTYLASLANIIFSLSANMYQQHAWKGQRTWLLER